MKKYLGCIIFTIIVSFIFCQNVYAECSYQERKELLNATKNVEININSAIKEIEHEIINPNNDELETTKVKVNYFQLQLTGITDEFFAIITNNYNDEEEVVNSLVSKDGIYTKNIDNVSDIYTYTITFYSENDNCYAEKITNKKVKKPKENPIYFYSICSNEEVMDNKYCSKFIDSEFNKSEEEIIKYLNSLIDKEEEKVTEEKVNITKTLKKYWYIPVIVFGFVIIVLIIIFVNKKRGELR